MTTDDAQVQGPDGGDRSVWDVVIVGAGLAGLAAAATAARSGARVAVLDRHRPGGRARSVVVEPGVVFNGGPRALYAGGAGARVLSELGVRTSGRAPDVSASCGIRDGRVAPLPAGPISLVRSRLLSVRSKVAVGRLLSGLQRLDPATSRQLSTEDWIEANRLAPDAASLVRAIVRLATYSADTDALSADAAVSQLQLALGEGVTYLDGGWQQLVDALIDVATDAGATVLDHVGVRGVERAVPGAHWTVHADGRELHARSVVLAAGHPAAVATMSPVQIDTTGLGDPVTAACWEVASTRAPDVPVLLGLDDPLYLSVHGPPAQLGPPGLAVLHAIRYGARNAAVDRAALRAHARCVGIEDRHVVADRFLARMVVSGGSPLPGRGLEGRPPVVVPAADGLFLAGDWVGDEGLLGDAALASGQRAGRAAHRCAATAANPRPVDVT